MITIVRSRNNHVLTSTEYTMQSRFEKESAFEKTRQPTLRAAIEHHMSDGWEIESFEIVNDLALQKRGVDCIVTGVHKITGKRKTFNIDSKEREGWNKYWKDGIDLYIECVENLDTGHPGWLFGDKITDYVILRWGQAPEQSCMWSVAALLNVYHNDRATWEKYTRRVRIDNGDYRNGDTYQIVCMLPKIVHDASKKALEREKRLDQALFSREYTESW